MILLVLAYLGGMLTILSPCILPVVPLVFSRADQSFLKNGLPLLAGMAITFAGVGTIAAFSGGWAVRANQYGRVVALIVFAIFGLTLISSGLAERLSRPLVRLGGHLAQPAGGSGVRQSFELGFATGLLWAPCAGPILGLVLTEAALEGASLHTSLLLLAYGAGAATSLAVVLLAGRSVVNTLKRSLAAEVWVRRALGVAVLAGVAGVALGADRGILTRLSLAGTSSLEQKLLVRFHPRQTALPTSASVSGAVAWVNSPPLTVDALKGKVTLVDFWTYSCINCLRSLPYVRAWAEKYNASGLVVLGVHTPEFSFERDVANVESAVHELGVTYPVAIDNNYTIWSAFNNAAWPAHYLIDASGHIRYRQWGEGEYRETEREIQQLLGERNGTPAPAGFVQVDAKGAEAPADNRDVRSPETALGSAPATSSFTDAQPDGSKLYTPYSPLSLNQWGLAGRWLVQGERVVLVSAPGRVLFRFHARDLHMVLGAPANATPIRFRIKLGGHPPGVDHGADTDDQGYGTVVEHRLYQLIRQKRAIDDQTFEIEFLDPGVQAFSFTFG